MDPSQIVPFDAVRLFTGDAPFLFYAEIVCRTLLIYAWTLALIRWIGGRSVSQLSLVDFVLVVALGSAVGDAMFYADVPLLQAMFVVALVVGASKGLEKLVRHFPALNPLVDDSPVEVVNRGSLVMRGLASRNVAPDTLKEMLRLKDISNLGEVEGAWIEGGGSLSVLRADPARPGLPIMPPPEIQPLPDATGTLALCATCGTPGDVRPCGQCHGTAFTDPTLGAARI